MSEYIHNMDPFAIQFSQTLGIRWYGLAYLAGFVVCFFILHRLAGRGKILLPLESVGSFVSILILGTLVGGRLGYCLFYDPGLLFSFSEKKLPLVNLYIPLWNVLAFWKGGMSSHGGILGLAISCWLFSKKIKVSALHLMDLTLVAGSLGVGLGRLANFVNGELYGRACNGHCFWPVKFPKEIFRWVSNSELYRENLISIFPVVQKMGPFVREDGKSIELNIANWTQWVNEGSKYYLEVALVRILNTIQVGNEAILRSLGDFLTPRHPSQLYQAFMEGFLVFFILWMLSMKAQKPGVLLSIWGICYSLMRILGEQFRMPDVHLGYQWWGLTRGQWLSLVMLAIFIGLLKWTWQRPVEKICGREVTLHDL